VGNFRRLSKGDPSPLRSIEHTLQVKGGLLKSNLLIRIIAMNSLLLFAWSAAQGQKVTSDYDRTTDFPSLKSYGWSYGWEAPNPDIDLYIKTAIDQELEEKGLRKVEPKEADVLVAYYLSMDTTINASTFHDPTYTATGGVPPLGTTMWSSGTAGGNVGRYVTKGTLAIEIYDRKEHKVVWEAAANAHMKEKRREKFEQLEKVLTKLLERYPPVKK
jgi:uncharacterized protein DUF4136